KDDGGVKFVGHAWRTSFKDLIEGVDEEGDGGCKSRQWPPDRERLADFCAYATHNPASLGSYQRHCWVLHAIAGCTLSRSQARPDPLFNGAVDVRRRRTPTQARARRPPTSRPPHPPAAGAPARGRSPR